MKSTILLLLSLVLAFGDLLDFENIPSIDSLQNADWKAYKAIHGKKYENDMIDLEHLQALRSNLKLIKEHNERYNKGEEEFELGVNELSDLTQEEYNKLNGFRIPNGHKRTGRTFIPPMNVKIPESVDWRNDGYVTDVKNQGSCGSCWAFSATGALEGQHKRVSASLVSLSEQNLVDCSSKYGNHGCNGGLMNNAFNYVADNRGIDIEKGYPYRGFQGKCRFSKKYIGGNCTGFEDVEEGDEEALKKAVATVGPISVAIDASDRKLQSYKIGIYYNSKCSSEQLNHGVLLVGYGSDKSGDYWIVKNSWGKSWGMDGYIHMARNRDNNCGIASYASYPTV